MKPITPSTYNVIMNGFARNSRKGTAGAPQKTIVNTFSNVKNAPETSFPKPSFITLCEMINKR